MYFMSLLWITRGMAEVMERITRDFLWDGADGELHCHLVAWEHVCKPKERRGLGIANICTRKWTLLGKWWLRCSVEDKPLLRKVTLSKYGLHDNG